MSFFDRIFASKDESLGSAFFLGMLFGGWAVSFFPALMLWSYGQTVYAAIMGCIALICGVLFVALEKEESAPHPGVFALWRNK